MATLLKIINFIRVNGKNHRQFRNFVEELELEDAPSDVSLYCVVRWLSNNVPSRFVDLLKPINFFLDEKRKCYFPLKNNAWIQDLMFLTDKMKHLQILNLALQGTEKIISGLAQTAFSFQNKIKIFQRDIMSKTFRHFPYFKTTVNAFTEVITDHKVEEYKEKLQTLLREFQARFDDLQQKPCFTFLVNPFDIDVINDGCLVHQPFVTDVSAAEMDLTGLQEDLALKNFNKCHSTVEFWQQVTERKFPELKKTSA